MARGGPLQRRVPLPRGEASLPPRSARSVPGPNGARAAPQPRPLSAARQAKAAAERSSKRIVKARSGGVCEGCGQARANDWSHRVGEGVGGPWCPSNGLHLCRIACHGFIGAEPTAARDLRGWRLDSWDDPLELPARHWLHGFVLLDVDGGMTRVGEVEALTALARIFPC